MKELKKILNRAKSVLLVSHVNPDADALCSMIVLDIYFRRIGKKVCMVLEEPLPDRFRFLPGCKRFKHMGSRLPKDFDLTVALDCGDLDRVGKVKTLIREDSILMNIDHHVTNTCFGDVNLVDPKVSSTAELLFYLLKALKAEITKPMAINLYSGIMTDTGSFRFDNTAPQTHYAVAELLESGFSPADLYHEHYETMTITDLMCLQKILQTVDCVFGERVVLLELRKSVIRKFSEFFDLRGALFQMLNAIRDVEGIVIFTEVSRKETRINFRSSTDSLNVAKLANSFNGGGHKRASGGTFYGTIAQTRAAVLRELKKII